MKRSKSLLLVCCATILSLFLLAGCSDNNTTNSTNSTSSIDTPSKDAIKIDQIEWEASNAVENGFRRVEFVYTNNSKYPIAELQINFAPKDETTLEDIKSVLTDPATTNDSLVEQVNELTEENYSKINVSITSHFLTDPQNNSVPEYLTAGSLYLTNKDQLDLFTPNMMMISYVNGDEILKETYDYATQSYSLSKDKTEIQNWPENELAQMLPTPEEMLLTKVTEKDGKLTFETMGTTPEVFENYVDLCKDAGFSTDAQESDYTDSYKAKNSDGTYILDLYLNTWGELDGTLKPVE